jgi:mannose-6-phosphate isomerase-like protein (cupin superfamily)
MFGTFCDLCRIREVADPTHLKRGSVYRVHSKDLPAAGVSHRFVGADNGDVDMSAFIVTADRGRGPGPHRHPYDEIQFILAGRARYIVDGVQFEAGAGEIVVVKAGEVHSFESIGETPLEQIDVHLNREFIQENL